MYPNKSSNKQPPTKSALGNLLLSDKGPRTPNRSTLVSPILQQVGKLAAGVANVSTEISVSGSATGNPRNKVALQPGHSLMDWIRLGASGKDLTGVGSRAGHLAVTKLELSRHNKINDIWLAIRGKVYNVTAYVPFHPGGPDELMKAAGIDATRLFDQVHPWVNYDQILQKCFIGRLVESETSLTIDDITGNSSSPFQSPTRQLSSKSTAKKFSCTKPPPENNLRQIRELSRTSEKAWEGDLTRTSSALGTVAQSSSEVSREILDVLINKVQVLPRFDWIQKLDTISIIFYTRAFSNPMVEIYPPTTNKTVTISLTYDDSIFQNDLLFYEDIAWPCSSKVFCETGKVELTFRKKETGVWENYGQLKQYRQDTEALKDTVRYNFIFKNKVQVTHNIFLLELERTDGAKIIVPIGKHIRAFVNVDGEECSRSYTPVPKYLFSTLSSHASTTDSICLMIRRYENGYVSSYLTQRSKNDMIYLTRPLGDIDLKKVEKKEVFLLLAAGTGITPMFGLLLFLLERRIRKCQFLRLLFFNRTEQDIPFREKLDAFAETDSRFKVDYILSEPDENWTGLSGHISKELVENSILDHIKDTGYTIRDVFTFICGPNIFLTLSVEELIELDFIDEQIHTFQG